VYAAASAANRSSRCGGSGQLASLLARLAAALTE